MRVLWVEDFGGELTSHAICRNIFSEILLEECREALARSQVRGSDSNRPSNFAEWRVWYKDRSSALEIDIYRHASDFDELLKTGCVVERYDVVLLDINLESNFFDQNSELIPTTGGFWLYNKLVRAGFPSGRIALLTANSDEPPTKTFLKVCAEYGHEPLEAFDKSKESLAGNWLKRHGDADDRFMHLRRGVLDGIDFANDLLNQANKKEQEQAIRFNSYVGSGEKLSPDQGREYLFSLSRLLPIYLSDHGASLQLRGFRYLLGCEWERAKAEWGENPLYQSMGTVMKYLRNWSSHGHLLDSANVGDISYLGLVSLRTGFRVPESEERELRHYEHHLLSVMNVHDIDLAGLPKRLATSYLKARGILRAKVNKPKPEFSRLYKNGKRERLQDRNSFHEVVNELALAVNRPDFDFVPALRELFVHAVLTPTISDDDAEDIVAVEAAYVAALQNRRDALPAWVTATWTRL